LAASDVLIDFGSGTGTFAMAAARRCTRVHAVDVSEAMIEHAKFKSDEGRDFQYRLFACWFSYL
jgi:putative AdoMet-dependent methyltransferase